MKSVPTNLPFPLLYGSVDLTLTSELISNLISYKPVFFPAPAAGSRMGTRAVCAKPHRREEIAVAPDKTVQLVFSDGSPSVTLPIHKNRRRKPPFSNAEVLPE